MILDGRVFGNGASVAIIFFVQIAMNIVNIGEFLTCTILFYWGYITISFIKSDRGRSIAFPVSREKALTVICFTQVYGIEHLNSWSERIFGTYSSQISIREHYSRNRF